MVKMGKEVKPFVVNKHGKCGGCNCRAQTWILAETKHKALELYENFDMGLCANCLLEILKKRSYTIWRSDKWCGT